MQGRTRTSSSDLSHPYLSPLPLGYTTTPTASSGTQGRIVGARESLNGRKNMARRKVKNDEKSPWGQCLTRPVPNDRRRSDFWLVPENFCVFLPNQKAERRRIGNKCNWAGLIAELSRAKRAQRSTMGKKMWSSTHPRKFGNHVTVHRRPERPSVCTTGLLM